MEITKWFVFVLFNLQCSAIGASNCYLISYLVGVRLVMKYIPEKVESWSKTVSYVAYFKAINVFNNKQYMYLTTSDRNLLGNRFHLYFVNC